MLKIKVFLIFILIGQLGLNAQTFDVSIDTINIDTKELIKPSISIDMTHAVKFDDNYYCFFKEQDPLGFKMVTKYFFIISDKGDSIKNIEVPAEIEHSVYFDFFIRNGRLLVKTDIDHDCFNFDLNKLKWNRIKELDDQVYEDNNFKVTYLDFGEWGQSTTFLDKQTKKQYVLDVSGTIVNKFNDKYYLTNGCGVLEVADPRKLKQVKINLFRRIFKKRMTIDERPIYAIGSEVFFEDTTFCLFHSRYSYEMPDRYIITTFVSNNKLYLLYSDTNSTNVGQIENGQLVFVQRIEKRLKTFNWNYSYRGNNFDNSSRFIKFEDNNDRFGIIEINNLEMV
jgi:hypothetical protein